MDGIKSNEWAEFEGGKAKVVYLSDASQGFWHLREIIKFVKPDVIFLSVFFQFLFTIYFGLFSGSRRILQTRGMMWSGKTGLENSQI